MSDFWTQTTHKARKAHRCENCTRTIQPDETYTRYDGVNDGRLFHVKSCVHCDAYSLLIQSVDCAWLEELGLRDWVTEFGQQPRELLTYPEPLNWLRWASWFKHQWTDQQGNLRELPRLHHATSQERKAA